MTTADPTMNAITEAVTTGHQGDMDEARETLQALWSAIGPDGDPLHRCTLAHYMADLQEETAQALKWDVRAIDAADALTDDRAQRYHSSLNVRGFYPSLHLNLADNYRRLGAYKAARHHLDAARACAGDLPDDAYGQNVLTGIDNVAAALEDQTAEAASPDASGATPSTSRR